MKPFTKIGAGIFALMAFLHAVRLLRGFEAHIGDFAIPVWVSGIFLAVAFVMAWGLWKESR